MCDRLRPARLAAIRAWSTRLTKSFSDSPRTKRERVLFDLAADFFRQRFGLFGVAIDEQEEKFLSAPTADDVAFTDRAADDNDDAAEDDIPRQMAVRIVDVLAMVDIHHGHASASRYESKSHGTTQPDGASRPRDDGNLPL